MEDTKDIFRHFATRTSHLAGTPWAFILAFLVIAGWGATGPIFGFSDTWQLVINTSTTIVTFLMVFLIQNTQNRETRATHLKLDELLRSIEGARTSLVDLENLGDAELDRLEKQFHELRVKLEKAGRIESTSAEPFEDEEPPKRKT
jgi:low affinity Fe/Cu permease